MSDDTTTWLKKNPAVNPLRRSLKTSLRFHVPSSDMNNSIMSNPDKVKDQGLFIPRMLQRSTIQMKKSRASEFKVPEMVTKPVTKPNSKPMVKKINSGSGMKQKKIPTPNRVRKSLLPVTKAKCQIPEKSSVKSVLPRPSFFPNGSGRRTAAQRELIKKAVELSGLKKREEAESQAKAVAEESSVLRSILKKRTSLRRTSQMSSGKKPKAKKVLFDRFESSDGEKENQNDASLSSDGHENDFNTALDEPTVFLNFPGSGSEARETPFDVLKLWQTYKDNLDHIQSERTSLEDSFESLLQHSLSVQQEYKAYKETAEEMYIKLSRLGREIEEGLKRATEGETEEGDGGGRSGGKRDRERREGRIGVSERSKAIKRNSGRKSVPILKKELLRDMEDSFSIICRNNI